MAREELFKKLPEGVENVDNVGPFKIKRYPGSTSVVVLTDELVTCGGSDGRERAIELANRMNETWNKTPDRFQEEYSPSNGNEIPESPTYEDIEGYTRVLAEQITQSEFQPDYTIGISRGGWFPAMYLSLKMKWTPFADIDVKRTEDGEGRIMGDNSHINTEALNGKNVLLVEDMLETGRSAVVARKFLEGHGASVRLACYFARDFSEVKPDFVVQDGVSNEVFFPWERSRKE